VKKAAFIGIVVAGIVLLITTLAGTSSANDRSHVNITNCEACSR
jgi:hypothetical protein